MLSRCAVQAYPGGHLVSTQEKRGASQSADANAGAKLNVMTAALSEAQHLADSADLDARVRTEFRRALDHIEHTFAAVQQWFEARAKSSDPYAVLPVLAAQRVNRSAQLARDLSLDLENMDVTVETEGLQDLYQAIGNLHRQLGVLCKGGR
jgi:hypothetical protein